MICTPWVLIGNLTRSPSEVWMRLVDHRSEIMHDWLKVKLTYGGKARGVSWVCDREE